MAHQRDKSPSNRGKKWCHVFQLLLGVQEKQQTPNWMLELILVVTGLSVWWLWVVFFLFKISSKICAWLPEFSKKLGNRGQREFGSSFSFKPRNGSVHRYLTGTVAQAHVLLDWAGPWHLPTTLEYFMLLRLDKQHYGTFPSSARSQEWENGIFHKGLCHLAAHM